jgi:hypothetical protein
MIGAGGVEIAYAATRSLLVTLTMHAAILDALGVDMAAFRAVLDTPVRALIRTRRRIDGAI